MPNGRFTKGSLLEEEESDSDDEDDEYFLLRLSFFLPAITMSIEIFSLLKCSMIDLALLRFYQCSDWNIHKDA